MPKKSKPQTNTKMANRALPISWEIPDNLLKLNASHLIVQHDDLEFTISFFQIEKPIILGPDEQVEKLLKDISTVKAKCVARVVVAAPRFADFIKVMQSNLDKYVTNLQSDQEILKQAEQELKRQKNKQPS